VPILKRTIVIKFILIVQPVNEEGELLINESSGEAKTTGSDNDDALGKN